MVRRVIVRAKARGNKALAGHVGRQMMERYSHIRSRAKQAAIETLNEGQSRQFWRRAATVSATVGAMMGRQAKLTHG